jgi:FtsP/CotA-like multicopper oxidase with cupredoxin domain
VPFTGPISSDPYWVDIVINNLDEKGHPFHLHGHEFYVLATYGAKRLWGSYNPFVAGIPPGGEYNLENPVRKDTVYIPRRGYAVLRFKADNEGVWMFHCHVLWHQASGMAMAFQVGGDENGVFAGDEERKEKARAMCPKA